MSFAKNLSLIHLLATIVAYGAAIVYISYLTKDDIVTWFRNSQHRLNKNLRAFTMQEKMSNGKYQTVQGIFDTRCENIDEARIIESAQISSWVADIHGQSQIAIYEWG